MSEDKIRHIGRAEQTVIYLGKLFRMFLFQNDWKVLPMSALIAGVVTVVVGMNIFKTMEGTLLGAFALSCVCVWNGFFNSIQVICRERAIIKREHRSGMHISSYVAAHMIYQAVICLAQVIITIEVCKRLGMLLPEASLVTPWPRIDFGITLFLITYSSDMLALLISSFAKTTTSAMTIMPFLLIVELLFAGAVFSLPDATKPISNLTVTKWGLTAICAQGNYNSLPMVTVWNSALQMKDLEIDGQKPLLATFVYIEENGYRDEVLMKSGELNQVPEYNFETGILVKSWIWLIVLTMVFVAAAIILLEGIDKDKR